MNIWPPSGKIFENQTATDYSIINVDDPLIVARESELAASVMGFSVSHEVPADVWLDGDVIRARMEGLNQVILNTHDLPLPGKHNIANVLAAIAVGLLCGCSVENIGHAVRQFSGTAHVLEFVREYRGVKYYNDSKGTNVDATQKALASFDVPVVLIAGGKDKGGDFAQLRSLVQEKVGKAIVVIGEAAQRLIGALSDVRPMILATSLEEAVGHAQDSACSGEAVLFSPACASFDMFKSYEHRRQ